MNTTICLSCGAAYGVGDSPFCRDKHERWLKSSADNFAPYFDIGLGAHVESPDQRRRLARQCRVDLRDKPSKGDLSARRDRVEQQKREQRRARGCLVLPQHDDWRLPADSRLVSVEDGRGVVVYRADGRGLMRRAGF